jgi:hypothetical protein
MPVARTYNDNVWAASNTPPPAVTTPAPTETPKAPAPAVPKPQAGDWWQTRGGHELYDIFARIEKENPMAAMAFWDAVVGSGRGQNDLQAATIHKKFGGDMNAYNNWRNTLHGNSLDSSIGNFDLKNGKWIPGAGFNSQYVKDRTGWDVGNGWQSSWNWGDYQNNLKPGLQSTPGNEEAGSDSWKTYLYGARFTDKGVEYPNPYTQAVGSGIIQPLADPDAHNNALTIWNRPKLDPVAQRGPGTLNTGPVASYANPAAGAINAPPSGFTAPPPTAQDNSVPTTVNTGAPTAANPAGNKPGAKSYGYRNTWGQVR